MKIDYSKRITGWIETIDDLGRNGIFVFGSNLSGIHGKGAAATAKKWGAKKGVGEGLNGSTYALPTVKEKIKGPLSLEAIQRHVDKFIAVAKETPILHFYVTEVGCNLAGYTPKDIAPLFKDAVEVENISLPQAFWDILLEN